MKEKKPLNKKNLALVKRYVVLMIVQLLMLLLRAFSEKKSKNDVAKQYRVSKHILGNWAYYFQDFFSPEEWNKRKKLSFLEISLVGIQWGDDLGLVLNKGELARKMKIDNRELSRLVKMNLDKIGIDWEAWASCSVFPPKVCARIIELKK